MTRIANSMDDEPSSSPPPLGNTTHTLVVEIHDTDHLLGVALSAWLTQAANTVCAQLPNTGQVRVRIVDDQRMSQAHSQYSGLNSTTDVLTFDLAHADSSANKVLDTDLIICIDEARRQSADRTHNLEHELLLYIIHGTLHCLGYNDQDPESFTRMHTREDELLQAAGFGKIFHTTPPTPENQS